MLYDTNVMHLKLLIYLFAPVNVFYYFSGDCWTLHPGEDSSPVGQNKVPGSLWADLGSVSLLAQVNQCLWITFHGVFPFSFFYHSPSHLCHPHTWFLHFCHCFILTFINLRNKIALDSSQALFLLVAEKSMSCMSSSMGEIYSLYSDADGFLYFTYASQEMFGAPHPAHRPPHWTRCRDNEFNKKYWLLWHHATEAERSTDGATPSLVCV